jgi:PTH1 family peptidyl-tRNA hydrolase
LYLLVGLGNPGREHVINRHNLGFLAVEAWALLKGEEIQKKEFHSLTARLKVGHEDVLAMKPQTFMNRSGDPVWEAMQFYKVPMENVIVLHDEIDLLPQTFRIKRGGGHAGHNGLRSLMHHGENFLRFRMGVGRPPHKDMEVADYVLGNLPRGELEFWEEEMPNVCAAVDLCIQGKMELAMNQFHKKAKE